MTQKYVNFLADTVAIKLDIQSRGGSSDYEIVPKETSVSEFRLERIEETNEKGVRAGKFGWCVACRESADYYCKANRLPVCSLDCKLAMAT